MMIKGIYGFACVLLRLGPLLDGQSRLVYKKIVVVTNFLFSGFDSWSLKLSYSFAFFFTLHSFSRENTKCTSLCLVQQQKVTAIFFLKKNLENAIIFWVCHFSGFCQFWFERDGIQTDPIIRVLASIDVNYMENN